MCEIKDWNEKAKALNESETSSDYEFKLRGSPKNGLRIIRIPKKKVSKLNKHTKTYKENNGKTEPYTDDRSYRSWRFGTVNIRSGKEDKGSKIYTIAKQVAQLAAFKRLNIEIKETKS